MTNSETLMIKLSPELKDALGNFSSRQNKSISQVVREAVSNHIGYDLAQERRSKYASEEEERTARNKRARTRRKVLSVLLSEMSEADKLAQVNALKASLKELK